MSKKIEIRYFAMLREEAQKDKESIQTTAKTADEIYAEIKQKYNFSLEANQLKLSLNQKYADMQAEIKDGDSLVFIPPVAGG